MPVTGSLNDVKNSLRVDRDSVKVGGNGLDRFDTFIYCLDKDLKYINEIKEKYKDCKDDLLKKETPFISNSILKNASTSKNFLATYNFFCNYKDAREYCKYFYHIDDKLLNDLKKNGKKPICNADDVNNYIELANRYWKQKENYIESLSADVHRNVIELLKTI